MTRYLSDPKPHEDKYLVPGIEFASYLLMPSADSRRHIAGHAVLLHVLGRCADRYGVSLTAAILKRLEFTEERAVLVVSRDGFVLWPGSRQPAFKSRVFFRTRGVALPVASGSVAGGADATSELREPVELPAGVWFPSEPVTETTITSDPFDMTFSLLALPPVAASPPMEEQPAEDALVRMARGALARQGAEAT